MWQEVIAASLVVVAVVYLLWRWRWRKVERGCGGCSQCDSQACPNTRKTKS